jgi:hypothetical protein
MLYCRVDQSTSTVAGVEAAPAAGIVFAPVSTCAVRFTCAATHGCVATDARGRRLDGSRRNICMHSPQSTAISACSEGAKHSRHSNDAKRKACDRLLLHDSVRLLHSSVSAPFESDHGPPWKRGRGTSSRHARCARTSIEATRPMKHGGHQSHVQGGSSKQTSKQTRKQTSKQTSKQASRKSGKNAPVWHPVPQMARDHTKTRTRARQGTRCPPVTTTVQSASRMNL